MGCLILEFVVQAILCFVTDIAAVYLVTWCENQPHINHYAAILTVKADGCLCRFATDEGDKLLKVTPTDYAHLSQWQKGIVTTQDGIFRSFKPTGKVGLPEIVAHCRKKAADAPTHVA